MSLLLPFLFIVLMGGIYTIGSFQYQDNNACNTTLETYIAERPAMGHTLYNISLCCAIPVLLVGRTLYELIEWPWRKWKKFGKKMKHHHWAYYREKFFAPVLLLFFSMAIYYFFGTYLFVIFSIFFLLSSFSSDITIPRKVDFYKDFIVVSGKEKIYWRDIIDVAPEIVHHSPEPYIKVTYKKDVKKRFFGFIYKRDSQASLLIATVSESALSFYQKIYRVWKKKAFGITNERDICYPCDSNKYFSANKRIVLSVVSAVMVLYITVNIGLSQVFQKVADIGRMDQAEKLYEKSCKEKKNDDCETHLEEAKKIYKTLCEKGEIIVCSSWAYLEKEQGNLAEAKRLYEHSCNEGDMYSCVSRGLLEDKKKKNFQAKKWYKKACDKEYARGCAFLGNLEKEQGNIIQARKLYKKSCDEEDAQGCFLLGKLEKEQGNIVQARKLYKRACDDGVGCNRLKELEKDYLKKRFIIQKNDLFGINNSLCHIQDLTHACSQ